MTRQEWEAAYPTRQTHYLAFCNATGCEPFPAKCVDFQIWIIRRVREFIAVKGYRGDSVPPYAMDDFTRFLWGDQA